MTNIEIRLDIAIKALNAGKLSDSSELFIKTIKKYNKKKLKTLTPKQYEFLDDIYNKYMDCV